MTTIATNPGDAHPVGDNPNIFFARRRGQRPGRKSRNGAVLLLMSIMLVCMLALGALAIGVAQLQLAQTQAQIAVDCAALSAVAVLGEASGDSWREVAMHVASQNEAGGVPCSLQSEDVELGSYVAADDGSLHFVAGEMPNNAIRVDYKSPAGAEVQLAFPFMSSIDRFAVKATNVTAKAGHDVCLCLDRSQSMCREPSGQLPASIETTKPGCPLYAQFYPHPTISRWAILKSAIPAIVEGFEQSEVEEQLALVTFGSTKSVTYGGWSSYYNASEVDVALTQDYDLAPEALHHMWDDRPMLSGGTRIDEGIDTAIEVLTRPDREFAHRTIVLVSDGRQAPYTTLHIEAAHRAAAEGIVIHAICFNAKEEARDDAMEIAAITGGRYFFAVDEEELRDVFGSVSDLAEIAIVE